MLPLSIFRIPGLAAANITGLIAFAGMSAMFFFLTLYMQTVLGYPPIQTGSAYLPLCFGVGIAAGIASQLIGRLETRPIIVAGALVGSAGLGGVFVGVSTAANAGVPPARAGLAASLLNSCQQVGSALGLAVFSAVATSRTSNLLAAAVIGLRTYNAHSDAAPHTDQEVAVR